MSEVFLNMNKGDTFTSFNEIETKIVENSKKNYVQFYKKEAKTVGSVAKTAKRYLNPALIYYHVTWACVFGGRVFKSRGKGIRKSRTLRKEDICKAQISIRISDCGNKFVVIKVENVHNHVVDEYLYKQLPQQRQLPALIKEDTKKLLHLKVNKHLLKEELENKLNKNITLKDLTNLQSQEKSTYKNDIRTACEKVQEKFGANCHLLIDRNDMFRGMMFCTKAMQKSFEAYPEFLCLDATYKLLNIRAPVYLILNEDGNGESIVICVGILVQEDSDSLEWFFENFKSENPSWTKIKTVMTDKDLVERDAILKSFPGVTLQLCIFHVLKIFSTEITCDKYNITSSEKNIILDFLQKIVYSRTETEFKKLTEDMKNLISDRVFKYIDENWLGIKDQWCPYLSHITSNFLNTTNNRLECINSKLKKVISKNSSLEEFLNKLFTILNCLKEEQNFRLADYLNRRYTGIAYTDLQIKYKKLLSPYAFDKMCNQFNYTSMNIFEEGGVFHCYSKPKSNNVDNIVKYKTRTDCCNCYFYVSIHLPCKHIFAVRHHLNMDPYDSEIVADRWKLDYVLKNSNLFTNEGTPNETGDNLGENLVSLIPDKQKKILSQQEKFRILFVKCKLMASLGAEAQSNDFTNICSLFDNIILNFQKNMFGINIVDNEPNIDTINSNMEPVTSMDIPEVSPTTENQQDLDIGSNYSLVYAPNISANGALEDDTILDKGTVLEGGTEIVESLNQIDENLDYTEDVIMNEIVNNNSTITEHNYFLNLRMDADTVMNEIVIENDPVDRNITEDVMNETISNDSIATKNRDLLDPAIDTVLDGVVIENEDVIVNRNIIDTVNLSNIKVFPVKTRGRPKGCDKTVIGLKKKTSKHMLFDKKQKSEKKNIILSWILKDSKILKKLINSLDNIKPLDEIDIRLLEVNISIIRSYFTPEIWRYIKEIKRKLAKISKWDCPECSEEISTTQPSIRCDSCLHWLHTSHVPIGGENTFNGTKHYFCNKCFL